MFLPYGELVCLQPQPEFGTNLFILQGYAHAGFIGAIFSNLPAPKLDYSALQDHYSNVAPMAELTDDAYQPESGLLQSSNVLPLCVLSTNAVSTTTTSSWTSSPSISGFEDLGSQSQPDCTPTCPVCKATHAASRAKEREMVQHSIHPDCDRCRFLFPGCSEKYSLVTFEPRYHVREIRGDRKILCSLPLQHITTFGSSRRSDFILMEPADSFLQLVLPDHFTLVWDGKDGFRGINNGPARTFHVDGQMPDDVSGGVPLRLGQVFRLCDQSFGIYITTGALVHRALHKPLMVNRLDAIRLARGRSSDKEYLGSNSQAVPVSGRQLAVVGCTPASSQSVPAIQCSSTGFFDPVQSDSGGVGHKRTHSSDNIKRRLRPRGTGNNNNKQLTVYNSSSEWGASHAAQYNSQSDSE